MSVYRRGGQWWIDFSVDGKRYRHPSEVNTKTEAIAVQDELRRQMRMRGTVPKGKATLTDIYSRFETWLDTARTKRGRDLDSDTKAYYKNGWRLLQSTPVVQVRLNHIDKDMAESLRFSGGPYNTNCALKTLRRMLGKAVEWNLLLAVPKILLAVEPGRERIFTPEQEQQFLVLASQVPKSRPRSKLVGPRSPLRDVFLCCLDAGMRPDEVFCMKIEDIRWQQQLIFIPEGKTENSRRYVPMSKRLMEALFVRCGDRKAGWVFPSDSECGHLTTVKTAFNRVREKMQLGEDYVLYSARHTFGTYLYAATGNLALVMAVMGHSDVKTAMRYQHPDISLARAVIDQRAAEMAPALGAVPSLDQVRESIDEKAAQNGAVQIAVQ